MLQASIGTHNISTTLSQTLTGAVAEMRKAVEIEPLSAYAYVNLGNGLFFAQKFKKLRRLTNSVFN